MNIKRNIYAIYGLFRHEMIYELRSGLFVGAIILPVLVTIVFGLVIGFQGIPLKEIPVGIYQEENIFPENNLLINSTNTIILQQYSSESELLKSFSEEKITVGVLIQKSNSSITIRIIQDDTKSVIAKAAISSINSQLISINQNENIFGIIQIESKYGLDLNSESYLLQILSPGFIIMAVIYIAIIFSGFVIAQERDDNTIYELALAPVPQYVIILGKLLSGIVTLILETAIIYILVDNFILSSKGDAFEIILTAVLCGIGITGILYIATSFIQDFQKLRTAMGIPVFMPLIFLSGIFYPTQTFPRFLQDVTNFIPTAWASTIVKGIFFKGKSLFDYPDEFIKLVAFSFGTIIIGSYFLKRTLKQSG